MDLAFIDSLLMQAPGAIYNGVVASIEAAVAAASNEKRHFDPKPVWDYLWTKLHGESLCEVFALAARDGYVEGNHSPL